MANVIVVQPTVGLLDSVKDAPALPLSLLSACKYVAGDYEVKLIDQRIERNNWKQKLGTELSKNPICVGITCMLGPQIKYAIEISEVVKKISNVPVVWGGPLVSALPEQVLANEFIDIVVKGDGECTFYELAKALDKRESLENVKGISYKIDGKIYHSDLRPFADLNETLDIPYNLVNINSYLPHRLGVPTIDMETSRGCPNECSFCYNPCLSRRTWRSLTAEKVLERVRKVTSDFNIKGIWFIDDELFVDLNRARQIIQGISKLGLTWTVQGTTIKMAQKMDDNYIQMLEDGGCRQLNLGVESGSERILKMIKKGITVEQVLTVNQKFKRHKISPWFYFVIGFPTETQEELKETIELALRLLDENPNARISGLACFTPYPGTELFEESKEYGYQPPSKLEHWSSYATDSVNVPWVEGRLKKIVESLQFASFFVDKKINDVDYPLIIRLLGSLYQPLAYYRMKNFNFALSYEYLFGKLARKFIVGR